MPRPIISMAVLILWAALFWPEASLAEAFTDDSGQRIEVSRPFQRIISLYGAHTENLFSLGLDQEIIGVTRNEGYPPQALTKPVFHYREDPERFIAARPDLVLVRPMIVKAYKSFIKKLSQAGMTVVSLQPTGVGAMFDYWRKLGLLTGRQKEAERLVASFSNRLAALKARTEDVAPGLKKRVYFESMHSKMKTFSPSSMAVFALEAAGGINVANDARSHGSGNIAPYSKEKILARAAEIDVYLAQRGPMNKVRVETILNEPGFGAIKAVQRGQVYIVDEQIVSRPTRRLLEGVWRIGRFLYPDRFRGACPDLTGN